MVNRESIDSNVRRRLYAESMGKCMNPKCKANLFVGEGDIIEKAHIVPYCKTADNSYENLVVLCPNCHTNFDKNSAFTAEEVREWKNIRKNELDDFFAEKVSGFEQLCEKIVPLLSENKTIYEEYYLGNQKKLWDRFEPIILVNNRKIKTLLKKNMDLIQNNPSGYYDSNQDYVNQLLLHIDEFEKTRGDEEKIRKTLFPDEVNSIFGVKPKHDGLIPMTESLENLISKVDCKKIVLGVENPYILIRFNDQDNFIYLDDTPRLMQLFYSYNCFRKVGVRLHSLNYAIKLLVDRNIIFSFSEKYNLRKIDCYGHHIIFVYKYCLSRNDLERMMPEERAVIVNLHHWNGESCISGEAYEASNEMNVKLLTMKGYYGFVNSIKKSINRM